MANTLFGGFHPVDSNGRTRRYEVASGFGTAFFAGDVATATTAGVAEIATAGDADLIIGVVKEVEYTLAGKRVRDTYLPASTTYSPTSRGSRTASYVWVYTDPLAEYWVCIDSHADTDTAAEVYAAVNCNMDHVAGAGNTVYRRSGFTLDGNTIEATAQWRVLEVRRCPGNDLASVNWMARVCINEGFMPVHSTAGI
jgi:hypothetical protein